MTETAKRIPTTRATRKPAAPFKLSKEVRDYLAAHERYAIASRLFDEALPPGVPFDDITLTPSAERLHKRFGAEVRRMQKRSDELAQRLDEAARVTLSDVLLLAMASWHSSKAKAGVSAAVLRAAKIDMSSL